MIEIYGKLACLPIFFVFCVGQTWHYLLDEMDAWCKNRWKHRRVRNRHLVYQPRGRSISNLDSIANTTNPWVVGRLLCTCIWCILYTYNSRRKQLVAFSCNWKRDTDWSVLIPHWVERDLFVCLLACLACLPKQNKASETKHINNSNMERCVAVSSQVHTSQLASCFGCTPLSAVL